MSLVRDTLLLLNCSAESLLVPLATALPWSFLFLRLYKILLFESLVGSSSDFSLAVFSRPPYIWPVTYISLAQPNFHLLKSSG